MERLEFFVQGTFPEPYRVTIEKKDESLNGFCTCAAGANGQSCKHVHRILSGNPEGLLGSCDELLHAAVEWIVGTDVETALKELIAAEDQCEIAKRVLSTAKKKLSTSLRK